MPRGFFLPMKIYTPSYYARFRCLAGDCRDTCCRGWEIDIDPESYARYLAQPGKIGDRLRAARFEQRSDAAFLCRHQHGGIDLAAFGWRNRVNFLYARRFRGKDAH